MTIPIIKTLVSADIENATSTEQKVWKKFCGFIEKDINSRGGIGGLPVKLAYRPSVQPLNRTARAKQQIREMRETDCVINVNMTTSEDAAVLSEIASLDAVIFTDLSEDRSLPRNVFYNERSNTSIFNRLQKYCELTQPRKILMVLNPHSTPSEEPKENQYSKLGVPIETITLDLDKDFYGTYSEDELTGLVKQTAIEKTDLVVMNVFGQTTQKLAKILTEEGYRNLLSLNLKTWNVDRTVNLIQCGEEAFPNYSFFEFCRQIDVPYSYRWITLFEHYQPLYLIQAACEKSDLSLCETKEDLTNMLIHEISKFDGSNDAFIGLAGTLAYQNRWNILGETRFYQSNPGVDQAVWLYLEKQLSTGTWKPVAFVYVDILRIIEVNENDKLWKAEFEVDINSPDTNPIDHIRFINRSVNDTTWHIKEVARTNSEGQRTQQKIRIIGAFDLNPEMTLYPFDAQYLDMELGLEQSSKAFLIQPTPLSLIDRKMSIDGWKLFDLFSGLRTVKDFDQSGTKLDRKLTLSQNPIISWGYQRNGSQIILRSLLPLIFLFFITWHTTFLPLDQVSSAISLNTTVFLAAIALYFSADKPKTGTLTLIDKIFSFFYFLVGVNTTFLIVAVFIPQLHESVSLVSQFGLPIAALSVSLWLHRKVKKNRKKVMDDVHI